MSAYAADTLPIAEGGSRAEYEGQNMKPEPSSKKKNLILVRTEGSTRRLAVLAKVCLTHSEEVELASPGQHLFTPSMNALHVSKRSSQS